MVFRGEGDQGGGGRKSWRGGLGLPRQLQKPRTAIASLKPDPRHGAGRTAPPRGTAALIIVATVTILPLSQYCGHYNGSNDVIIVVFRFSRLC